VHAGRGQSRARGGVSPFHTDLVTDFKARSACLYGQIFFVS
jgi:hypothetical protein